MKRTELFKAKNVQMLHSFWEREEKKPPPSPLHQYKLFKSEMVCVKGLEQIA